MYVDDILIFGPQTSSGFVTETKHLIQDSFECKDLGTTRFILGLEIQITQQGIEISQTGYINKILDRFGFTNCRPVATPLDPNAQFRVDETSTEIDSNEYQSIIGSLMYAAIGTRPDLAYTTTFLSQYNSTPSTKHLQAAKRALRYLRGTTEWSLFYPRGSTDIPPISCYTDASCASDLDTRRSFSGYLVRLNDFSFLLRSLSSRRDM